MQCPYCGNRLRSDDLFCPACGRRVGQSGAKHGKKKKRGKKGFSPAKWVLPLLLALLVVALRTGFMKWYASYGLIPFSFMALTSTHALMYCERRGYASLHSPAKPLRPLNGGGQYEQEL